MTPLPQQACKTREYPVEHKFRAYAWLYQTTSAQKTTSQSFLAKWGRPTSWLSQWETRRSGIAAPRYSTSTNKIKWNSSPCCLLVATALFTSPLISWTCCCQRKSHFHRGVTTSWAQRRRSSGLMTNWMTSTASRKVPTQYCTRQKTKTTIFSQLQQASSLLFQSQTENEYLFQ